MLTGSVRYTARTRSHKTSATTAIPAAQLTARIDAYITQAGLDVPARSPYNTDDAEGDDGARLPETTTLDLRAAGISSVVWATGFTTGYAFVRLPTFDAMGYPLQRRGVSPISGLYFMGVHYQHTAKSDLFLGVGEDAAYVAAAVAAQVQGQPPRPAG